MATTESRPLFDIPLEKLREAFVRNRFGQGDVFGRADVETWFQWQRAQNRPPALAWQTDLARDFIEMCAATMPLLHLQDRATRYTPFQQGTERAVAPFGRILPLFKDGFYWGYQDVGVYVHEPMKELFVLSETHGKLTIERIVDSNLRVGAKAVVDVLFAEWDRQRPKWREARAFLCDALAEEIKRERAKAEHDFDTAVAVSTDGTKIVHADWVVVHCGIATRGSALYDTEVRDRFLIFRSEWFRSHKARRPNNISRAVADARGLLEKSVTAKTITPNEIAAIVARNVRARVPYIRDTDDALLFTCNVNGAEARIYCTTVNLCSSPLPDGGVEVTT